MAFTSRRTPCLWIALAGALAGCVGQISGPPSARESEPPVGADQPDPPSGRPSRPRSQQPGPAPAPSDPGPSPIRQLDRIEYDNTVRDLLGTTQRPGATFPNDAPAIGFDNDADQLSISPTQAGLLQRAAESLAAEALTGPARARIVTCDVGSAACARSVIAGFGARAYRRPLAEAEIAGYLSLLAKARAAGATADEALQTVVEAFLLSPWFLYRVELDPPGATAPHAVGPYEMASRLSYLIYRSMPDPPLFEAAAAGRLVSRADLQAQLTRMLSDPQGATFARDFSAQWLGVTGLENIRFDAKLFPRWKGTLGASMKTEITAFFDAFVREDLPLARLLTADFSYLDRDLTAHYGLPPVPAGPAARVTLATPQRAGGLLTMAGTLAVTSYMTRTSLVKRGAWVSAQLLCTEPPPPPANVPPFPDNGMVTGTQRQILEMHRKNPSCGACHEVLDNIGLALETYDATGAWRTQEDGSPIDARGELEGVKFDGGAELARVLAADARFTRCLATKLLSYALGREVEPDGADAAAVKELAAATAGPPGVRDVLERVVTSAVFTTRRGDAP